MLSTHAVATHYLIKPLRRK
ncbi:putative protein E [Bacillus phage Nf]|uniref:Uncharacterized protein n=1 Tax=Bacillus phage Nf TaxID=2992639 RepID=B7SSN9_BPNF|nr:putative protein E [Bacillus phage Nf]ACH57086.1 putative protein E [Bacillus phage Nf]